MKTLLLLLGLIAGQMALAEDMQEHLSKTRDLIERKHYEEALERVLWFHDHALEHEPAMYGVRLSFALADWKKLGEAFPPARKAMVETRDKKAAMLKEGKGNRELFQDVAALNDTLEQSEETVRLFEALPETPGKDRSDYWNLAKDAVLAAKRFDIAKKHIGDVTAEFTKLKRDHERMLQETDNDPERAERFKAYANRHFVKEILQLIEFALATGDRTAALKVQKNALAVVADRRLQDAVPAEGAKK